MNESVQDSERENTVRTTPADSSPTLYGLLFVSYATDFESSTND